MQRKRRAVWRVAVSAWAGKSEDELSATFERWHKPSVEDKKAHRRIAIEGEKRFLGGIALRFKEGDVLVRYYYPRDKMKMPKTIIEASETQMTKLTILYQCRILRRS